MIFNQYLVARQTGQHIVPFSAMLPPSDEDKAGDVDHNTAWISDINRTQVTVSAQIRNVFKSQKQFQDDTKGILE